MNAKIDALELGAAFSAAITAAVQQEIAPLVARMDRLEKAFGLSEPEDDPPAVSPEEERLERQIADTIDDVVRASLAQRDDEIVARVHEEAAARGLVVGKLDPWWDFDIIAAVQRARR